MIGNDWTSRWEKRNNKYDPTVSDCSVLKNISIITEREHWRNGRLWGEVSKFAFEFEGIDRQFEKWFNSSELVVSYIQMVVKILE